MNDTPRTDEFETAYFEDSTSHVDDVFEYARKLERENAALRESIERHGQANDKLVMENSALRADKERLDWMNSQESNSTELRWTDDIRAAIDAARKEGKP